MTRAVGGPLRRLEVTCDACGKSDHAYVAPDVISDGPSDMIFPGYVSVVNVDFEHDICTKCLYAAFPTLLTKGDDNAA